MGKTNRVKRHQASAFPFSLLMFWVKVANVERASCHVCHGPAEYEIEHYVNPLSSITSVSLNAHWIQCIDEQMGGKYINYFTTYNCSSCTRRYLQAAGGNNVADLSLVFSMIAGNRVSQAIGCKVQNRNDGGKTFVAHVSSTNLDGLAKQFKSNNAVHINLKG